MMPDFERRLSEKRLARVPRYLSICAGAWTAFAMYFCATNRPWSANLCAVEATLAFTLILIARHRPRTREAIAHLNLLFACCGIIVEGAVSGGFLSDSPVFLTAVGVLAAHQLGIRAAIGWTIAGVLGMAVAFWGFDPATTTQIRVPTDLDKVLMYLGMVTLLYTMSHEAERSFERQVSQLIHFAQGLQEHTRLLQLSEQTAGIGHWTLDLAAETFTVSDQVQDLFGIHPNQDGVITLKEFSDSVSREDRKELLDVMRSAASDAKEFNLDLEFDDDGDTRYVTCRGFSNVRPDGRVHSVFGVLKDESRAHRAQQELLALATLDTLTQLPNRRSFHLSLHDALREADQNGTKVALLLADMDGFKQINDTLGHPTGDAILQLIATRLRESIGEENFVARIGGDEFVIVQRNIKTRLDVTLLGEQIARHVGNPYEHDGRELHVSASIGASIYPDDTRDSDELLSFADTAMYRTKESGDSVGMYDSAMTKDLVKRHNTENRLVRALEGREFSLEFQPQVKISDQGLFAFEALVRWHHDGSTVSPLDFIPSLESTGRIVEVGRWILQESCRQTKAWVDAGYDVGISVNISPIQFCDPTFVPYVWAALEQSGLAPERLDLELTESLLIHEVNELASKLDLIKTTGSRISIDDFGTGYSSLAYLKHLPIDRLKIDRTFVKEIPASDDGTIAKSMIMMAKNLGLTVLAEGVETPAQLDFLREHGCDEYQGFLFSSPLTIQGAESLMDDVLKKETSDFGGPVPIEPV